MAATVASIALFGTPGAIADSADRAQQAALKRFRIRRIGAHQIDDAARQHVAEQSEAAAQHRVRRDLPGDRGSRLQDRQRRGGENRTLLRLDHLAQRLIDVVRNGIERAGRRATAWCGFMGFELYVSRRPKVHVSVRVTFQVSCA